MNCGNYQIVSVKEMAEYLQVSDEMYQKYESGIEDIPASLLFEIAHKLHVDMATLLTGEEPRMNIFTRYTGWKRSQR